LGAQDAEASKARVANLPRDEAGEKAIDAVKNRLLPASSRPSLPRDR